MFQTLIGTVGTATVLAVDADVHTRVSNPYRYGRNEKKVIGLVASLGLFQTLIGTVGTRPALRIWPMIVSFKPL